MLEGSHNNSQDLFLFHFSSIKVYQEDSLVAAHMGKGVLIKHQEGEWEKISEGLPDDTHVNRLHVKDNHLFACTNKGLFELQNDQWQETGLAISCYQYKNIAGYQLAATPYGLWSKSMGVWQNIAYPKSIVYDFLYMSQFIILALDYGLAMYDRFTGTWAEFPIGKAITGLAVYQGHVLGITEHGKLLQGNKQGAFEEVSFDNMFLFSIVTKGSEVYVCSDRGLFRINYIRNRITLMSVRLGCAVTDIDCDGSNMYMATLFEGIQTIDR